MTNLLNILISRCTNALMNPGGGKFNDWFLPSYSELYQMYLQLRVHSVGGFSGDFYWTSSEYNATTAWTVFFTSGFLNPHLKQDVGPRSVRACRKFNSTHVYNIRDVGPAGGLIFLIEILGGGVYRYHEAAPTDQATASVTDWSNIVNVAIGTTGTAFGDGQSNTAAIIAQPGHVSSAAKLCADLIIITSINTIVSYDPNTNGIYLRWYYNGWHYFNFTNGYEITMKTENLDTQVSNMFSRISRTETPTKINAEYSYQVILEGISEGNINGFVGLLLAEKVEQYESLVWREVELTRGEHAIKDGFYSIEFEITRKELPNTPSVYLNSQFLYLGDTLCDIGNDELIALNKQVNDIAEMQDRQADFTAQFKIRKTRAMKLLFELSGEVGATTLFPYENKTCKLIQNGIEVIPSGKLMLDKSDDNYYYVSILSGNADFFKTIEKLKLGDLSLPGTAHTWHAVFQKASNESDLDYLYPLVEPSNDGVSRISDDGEAIKMYAAYIWPFVKVKAIWDEIFLNAGFTPEGKVLTNDTFLRLFMPIASLKTENANTDIYLYSGREVGFLKLENTFNQITLTEVFIGDDLFLSGTYLTRYSATYTFRVCLLELSWRPPGVVPEVYLYENGVKVADFTFLRLNKLGEEDLFILECTKALTAGKYITFYVSPIWCMRMDVLVTNINLVSIGYGSTIASLNIHLPALSQIDFIKMICNIFGLIPETNVWDKKIKFWNYLELYDNISLARDWSAYLSESEGETEFKFGDYAQNNYLKYKDSDDVLKNEGRGNFQVKDETLPFEKDAMELPVSTCDQVQVLGNVDISRINFNTFNPDAGLGDPPYNSNDTIGPRIVFVKTTSPTASPLKKFVFHSPSSYDYSVTTPRLASSLEIAMSSQIDNYAGLSRLLTQANFCRLKFNLPVFEVENLKHYIPIYLSQKKAYFAVIIPNNYIPGRLCTVDLIKL